MDRRAFVASLSAAPLMAGLAGCGRPEQGASGGPEARADGAGGPSRASVAGVAGVQLYTVREAMAEDLDGTLAELAAIGYRDVELAGTYGLTSAQFRAKLDAAGLRAVSGHIGLEELQGDWQRALDGAAELGHELVVVPWLPEDVRTGDGYRTVAQEFNRAGEAAARMGMRFGYHNHEFEFVPTDGAVPMALLLDETDPALVDWQMDIYWTVDGGEDPLAWLDRYRGRVTSVHIKDRSADGEMVAVGDGVIDFPRILTSAAEQGLRYGFVEHDFPEDPIESVRRSFNYLMTGASA